MYNINNKNKKQQETSYLNSFTLQINNHTSTNDFDISPWHQNSQTVALYKKLKKILPKQTVSQNQNKFQSQQPLFTFYKPSKSSLHESSLDLNKLKQKITYKQPKPCKSQLFTHHQLQYQAQRFKQNKIKTLSAQELVPSFSLPMKKKSKTVLIHMIRNKSSKINTSLEHSSNKMPIHSLNDIKIKLLTRKLYDAQYSLYHNENDKIQTIPLQDKLINKLSSKHKIFNINKKNIYQNIIARQKNNDQKLKKLKIS